MRFQLYLGLIIVRRGTLIFLLDNGQFFIDVSGFNPFFRFKNSDIARVYIVNIHGEHFAGRPGIPRGERRGQGFSVQ